MPGSVGSSREPASPVRPVPAPGPLGDTVRLPKDMVQAEYAVANRRGANSQSKPRQPTLVWLLVASALVAAVAFGPTLWAGDSPGNLPGDDSVEAGFARDMRVHHAQAVEISSLVRDRSDDPEIMSLAQEIATTHQRQVDQMQAWLRTWGLDRASSSRSRAWMRAASDVPSSPGDPHQRVLPAGKQFPGMASPGQVEQLNRARGREAEVLFLELMIMHHQAAIEMAEVALELSDDPTVTRLARSLVSSQTAEIQEMEELLNSRSD